jgi:hypothetical protein
MFEQNESFSPCGESEVMRWAWLSCLEWRNLAGVLQRKRDAP